MLQRYVLFLELKGVLTRCFIGSYRMFQWVTEGDRRLIKSLTFLHRR